MQVTVLGCGPSGGVPLATGDWGACDDKNPYNTRTRSSVLVEVGGKTILIDATPDVRQQLLRARCTRIDAVFMTHQHYDHVGGLSDLLAFYFAQGKQPLPVYANPATINALMQSVPYVFTGNKEACDIYPGFLTLIPVGVETFQVSDIVVHPFIQNHHVMETLGFRIGDFAYSTDVVHLTDSMRAHLQGLDAWVVDCLGRMPKPTHSHLDQTLDWIAEFKPERAFLTHMDRSLDYQTLLDELPPHIRPCYDGLVIHL